MTSIDYSSLFASFQTPADRAWYFTTYQCRYGSHNVPVSILHALGASARGSGTYCWTDGESELWIRGEFTERPDSWAVNGTVNITKAHYSVESPAWSWTAHYDYYLGDRAHEIAHFHKGNNSDPISMHDRGNEVLDCLELGLSDSFVRFLRESELTGVDVFQLSYQ